MTKRRTGITPPTSTTLRRNPNALITPPPTTSTTPTIDTTLTPTPPTVNTPAAPVALDALDAAAAHQRDGTPASPFTDAAAIDTPPSTATKLSPLDMPSAAMVESHDETPAAPRADSTGNTPEQTQNAAVEHTIAFTINEAGHVERVAPVSAPPADSTVAAIDPTSSAAILGDPAVEIAPPPSTLLAPSDVPVEIAGLGGVIVQSVDLDDYTLDPKNANKGSERTDAILDRGLKKRGAGRSIFVGKNRQVIAGNQTLRRAKAAGFKRAVEIVIPRDVLAVVRREDVDENSEDGQLMAIEDNRSRDHSEWDASVIAASFDSGLLDDLLFRPDEVDALFASMTADIDIQSAAAAAAQSDGEKPRKLKQNKKAQVKAALYMEALSTFEKAIAATGIEQRAEAVATICRFYLDNAKKGEAAPV